MVARVDDLWGEGILVQDSREVADLGWAMRFRIPSLYTLLVIGRHIAMLASKLRVERYCKKKI